MSSLQAAVRNGCRNFLPFGYGMCNVAGGEGLSFSPASLVTCGVSVLTDTGVAAERELLRSFSMQLTRIT